MFEEEGVGKPIGGSADTRTADSLAMHHRVVATVAVAWSKQALFGSDRIL